MRLFLVIAVLLVFSTCQMEEDLCEGWRYIGPISSFESYSQSFVDTRPTVSLEAVDVFYNSDFCETPVSSTPGIYKIEGDVYENCQGKQCVEVKEWIVPFCIPDFELRDKQEELYGEWQVQLVSTSDTTYYPDCDYGTFSFTQDSINYADIFLEEEADRTIWYNLVIGHGQGWYPASIMGDTIIGGLYGQGSLAYYNYYFHFFEKQLSSVHLSDTLVYQIEGNQLTLLNLSDSSAIHLFKE